MCSSQPPIAAPAPHKYAGHETYPFIQGSPGRNALAQLAHDPDDDHTRGQSIGSSLKQITQHTKLDALLNKAAATLT